MKYLEIVAHCRVDLAHFVSLLHQPLNRQAVGDARVLRMVGNDDVLAAS
jgi:hypothetical protein